MFKYLLNSLRSQNPAARFASRISVQKYYSTGKSARIGSQMERQAISSPTNYFIPKAFAAILGLGAVGGLAYYLHANDAKRAIPTFPRGEGKLQQSGRTGAAIGGPFSLVNTENQPFTEQDFGGKWVLLYFGYTSSPETGPAEVQKIANTIDILESKQGIKVLPVFVTVDPKRDSTSQLKAYLTEFDKRLVGLTGTCTAVKNMARQYRVFSRKVEENGEDYLVETSHNLYLMNPNREIVRNFSLKSSEKERSEEILKEINKSKAQVTK